MSDHDPYRQPYGQPPSWQVQAPPAAHGFPPPPQKTNTMSILGLVFAFVLPLPLGLLFSAIGLKQAREHDESGRGLAAAGLIVSIVCILAGAVVIGVLGTGSGSGGVANGVITSAERPATSAAHSSSKDDEAVHAACSQIEFGIATSKLDSAKTVQEYQSEIGRLVSTLQNAAPGTGPQFTADVQKLIDDLDAVSAAVGHGQDPSSYKAAPTADGGTIDLDCAAVGVG